MNYKLLIVTILSLWSFVLRASSENYVIGIAGEELSAIWNDPEMYSTIHLEDPLLDAMPGDANSYVRLNEDKSSLSVKLWYEDVRMQNHTHDWRIDVKYYVELYPTDGGEVELRFETLTIDYSLGSGYSDIQLREYEGYLKADVTVTGVSVETSNTDFEIPDDVRLDMILKIDRKYRIPEVNNSSFLVMDQLNSDGYIDFDPVDLISEPGYVNVNTVVGELPLMWEHIPEATSYDLEWLFIDCLHGQHHDPLAEMLPTDPLIDFREATRVNVTTNWYHIPMGYPEGYLIVRMRPVGPKMDNFDRLDYGNWSYVPAEVSHLSDALASNNLTTPHVFVFDGIESGLNWQYSANFAEDGKRKEMLYFFDGSLRSRQSLTLLNTENKALVREAHYDFQGRPSLQIIPSPIDSQELRFYSNINGDYDKDDFDVDYFGTSPLTALPGEQGAHQYFSTDNTDLDGMHEAYIPDAESYPYTRSIYANDGTNRLTVQSRVGKTHRIVDPLQNDDHTGKIYYTAPTQAELDRLFGNNAGLAKHYQKVATKDENGQFTVSYIDQEGRVVATGLLGGNELVTNLMDLDHRPNPANIVTDLLTNNETVIESSNKYTKSSTTFFVPFDDPRMFTYDIDPGYFTSCSGDQLYCEYQLSIKVYNEFGEEVVDFQDCSVEGGGVNPLLGNITTDNFDEFPVTWTKVFSPGSYQIVKKLTLVEASIQVAHDVLLNELDAFEAEVVELENNGSVYTNEFFQLDYSYEGSAFAPITTTAMQTMLDDHAIIIKNQSYSSIYDDVCVSFQFDIPDCSCNDSDDNPENDCPVIPTPSDITKDCYEVYWDLIAEVSPGGQYFDNLPARQLTQFGALEDNENYYLTDINGWLNTLHNHERRYFPGGIPGGQVDQQICHNLWLTAENDPVEGYPQDVFPTGKLGCLYENPDDLYNRVFKYLIDPNSAVILSWEEIRYNWNNEWGQQWPMLSELSYPEYLSYLPLEGSQIINGITFNALDDLFHLHPESMSYENVCDVLAHKRYIDYDDKINSNKSLPDYDHVVFDSLLLDVTNELVLVGNELIERPIDLGLYYAALDFDNNINGYRCIPEDEDLTSLGQDYYIQNFISDVPQITAQNVDLTRLNKYITMSFSEYDHYNDVVWTNEKKDPFPCEERELLVYELMHFLPLSDGIHSMSVYAAIDDPLGIAIWDNGAYLPYDPVALGHDDYVGQQQVDAIRTIHDQFNVHGRSKWEFFKSTYMYFREKVNRKTAFNLSGRVYENDHITTISTTDLTIYNDHSTTESFIHNGESSNVSLGSEFISYGTSTGYTLHFPHNPIYDSDFSTIEDITEAFSAACPYECESRVSLYLEDLMNWMDVNNLTPLSETDYSYLEGELTCVCNCGCDESWESMTQMDLDALNSYNDADISYYECTSVNTDECVLSNETFNSIVSSFDNSLSGFVYQEPELSDAGSDEGTGSTGNCSCSLMTEYTYYNYYEIFGYTLESEDPAVTAENFALFDINSYLVSPYIDVSSLRNHLNSNPEFLGEENFIAYPTDPDLEALIILCYDEENKEYCEGENDSPFCFDALVTGTTSLSPGDNDYIYPIRELFICTLNNPTVAEEEMLECRSLWEMELENAMDHYHYQINGIMSGFIYEMINVGLSAVEEFTMSYKLDEFAYTLYYYDQAGNLVHTVPPAGVEIMINDVNNVVGDENLTIEDVQEYRDAAQNSLFVEPHHRMLTTYKYNSLNQLVKNNTPDNGTSKFYYDKLGRMVISQNAKQEANLSFSYTLYDLLGRSYETGEVKEPNELNITQALITDLDLAFDLNAWAHSGIGRHVTLTYYDYDPGIADIQDVFTNGQNNLRSRVVGVVYYREFTGTPPLNLYNAGTFYSYDPHGNVECLVQVNNDLKPLEHIKKIAYEYDLLSGNTVQVAFQQGEWDQFYHKYEYDADNRLTYTYTSDDCKIWEKESRQHYYEHGPQARNEIGDKQVQACDYTYAIQGWLKGINSPIIKAQTDVGRDGDNTLEDNLNSHFGKDAFGFSLDYYSGDYSGIGQTDNYLPQALGGAEENRKNLFNGNISRMVYAVSLGDPMDGFSSAALFRYDQFNRIKSSTNYSGSVETMHAYNNLSTLMNNGVYSTEYSFDFNGNLESLKRNGGNVNSLAMDDFIYRYNGNTVEYGQGKKINNRLNHVSDIISELNYDVDVDDQNIEGETYDWETILYDSNDPNLNDNIFNYNYDGIGQLIKDRVEGIDLITWTVSGKVEEIIRAPDYSVEVDGEMVYPPNLIFRYDQFGNRIQKVVKPRNQNGELNPDKWEFTYYVRDAQGNPLSIYNGKLEGSGPFYTLRLDQREINLYAINRLGTMTTDKYMTSDCGFGQDMSMFLLGNESYHYQEVDEMDIIQPNRFSRILGKKRYELGDHRGNVYNTISDVKRVGETVEGNLGLVAFYTSDIVSASDYYPYGMPIPDGVCEDSDEQTVELEEVIFTDSYENSGSWRACSGTTTSFGEGEMEVIGLLNSQDLTDFLTQIATDPQGEYFDNVCISRVLSSSESISVGEDYSISFLLSEIGIDESFKAKVKLIGENDEQTINVPAISLGLNTIQLSNLSFNVIEIQLVIGFEIGDGDGVKTYDDIPYLIPYNQTSTSYVIKLDDLQVINNSINQPVIETSFDINGWTGCASSLEWSPPAIVNGFNGDLVISGQIGGAERAAFLGAYALENPLYLEMSCVGKLLSNDESALLSNEEGLLDVFIEEVNFPTGTEVNLQFLNSNESQLIPIQLTEGENLIAFTNNLTNDVEEIRLIVRCPVDAGSDGVLTVSDLSVMLPFPGSAEYSVIIKETRILKHQQIVVDACLARSYNSGGYRYGFNGQEKDDEMVGSGNSYTALFWQYDPRIARRWNTDPVTFSDKSPYSVLSNRPVTNTDPYGDCDTCPNYIHGKAGDMYFTEDIGGMDMNGKTIILSERSKALYVNLGKDERDNNQWALYSFISNDTEFTWDETSKWYIDADGNEYDMPWYLDTYRAVGSMITPAVNAAVDLVDGRDPLEEVKTAISDYEGTAIEFFYDSAVQSIKDFGYEVAAGGNRRTDALLGMWVGLGAPTGKGSSLLIKGGLRNAIKNGFCFVAGTKVMTESGLVNIEEIKEEDLVWTYNEDNDIRELKRVEETYVVENATQLVEIILFNDTVWTTPDHPFFVNRIWTEAGKIVAGDSLSFFAEEVFAPILKVQKIDTIVSVYNFKVEQNHNYYVTDYGILVHNTNGCGPGKLLKKDLRAAKRGDLEVDGTYEGREKGNEGWAGAEKYRTPSSPAGDAGSGWRILKQELPDGTVRWGWTKFHYESKTIFEFD